MPVYIVWCKLHPVAQSCYQVPGQWAHLPVDTKWNLLIVWQNVWKGFPWTLFSLLLLESRHQTHCMQQLSSFWKWFQLTQCHAITEAAEQTQEASGWIIHMMSESGSPNHNDTKLRATTWAVDCDKAVKSTAAIPSTRCWPRCTFAGSGCHLQGLNLNVMSRAAAYAGVHFPSTFTKKYEWVNAELKVPA